MKNTNRDVTGTYAVYLEVEHLDPEGHATDTEELFASYERVLAETIHSVFPQVIVEVVHRAQSGNTYPGGADDDVCDELDRLEQLAWIRWTQQND